MKVLTQNGLHVGQVSIGIGQLASLAPSLFVTHHGEQLLVVTLAGSREHLEERVKQILNSARSQGELRSVGDAVLVGARGIDAILRALTRFDEVYVVAHDWTQDLVHLQSFRPDDHSFENGAPAEFVDAFTRIRALRYFADGLGTNFCVKTMEDASSIENAELTGGMRWS